MSGRRRTNPSARAGFALLTVLWVLTGMLMIDVLLNRTASEAIGTAQNRTDALRAAWAMEGCLAQTQAKVDEELSEEGDGEDRWADLDRRLASDGVLQSCDVVLRPVGVTLDVNDADRGRLLALLIAAGTPYERADSMAAAISDWRDADEDVQRGGAEQNWYHALSRPGPRNAPFEALDELGLVRGFEAPTPIHELLGIEAGRVLLTRAPAAVLATLPGFGEESIARLIELRAAGPVDLLQLGAALSPGAQALLQSHQMELAGMATASPDAWIVTAHARRSARGGPTSIELRVVRSGHRAAIMRHRTSPWS